MNIKYPYIEPGKVEITASSDIQSEIGHLYTYIQTKDSSFSPESLQWKILEQTPGSLLIKGTDSDNILVQTWKILQTAENSLEIDIELSLTKQIEVEFAYTGLACNLSYWHYYNPFTSGIFPALEKNCDQFIWPEYPEKEGMQISTGIKGSPLILFKEYGNFNYSSFKLAANNINQSNEFRYYRIDNHFGQVQWHPGKYQFFHGTINLTSDDGWMDEEDIFLKKLQAPNKIVLINPLGQGFSPYFSAFLKERFKSSEVINVLQNIDLPNIHDISITYPAFSIISLKERFIRLNNIRKEINRNKPDVTIIVCNNLKKKKDKYTWILGSMLSAKKGYLIDLQKKSKPLYSLPILIFSFLSKKLFYLSWDIAHPLIRLLLIPIELLGLMFTFIWLFIMETYYSLRGIRHKSN